MGNLCGKESKDNFAGEGRTLGTAPSPPSENARATVPRIANTTPKIQGAGRTLGGAGGGADDPRSAAAKAAEVRAAAQKPKTTRQQRQTDRAALEEASYAERRARDADVMADARAYN